MKKIFLSLFLCLCAFISHAQTPQAIPYQAVARNTSGNLVMNQLVSLRFSIHNASAGRGRWFIVKRNQPLPIP